MNARSRGWPARVAILAIVTAMALPALAHPVRIGRYAEIPYGVDPRHPYPTWGGGPRRSGRVRGVAPAAEPVQLWERTLRHRRPRGPIIAADGTLYVGTMGGLTALGPDGIERWSASLGAVHATPSFAPGGEVVVVTRGGLVALVSPEGVVRHTADLGAPARGSALVLDDGSVLVGTIDGLLHRLDANLRPVLAVPLEAGAGSTISLAARGLLAVPAGRTLTLLDTAGHLRHQVALGGVATARSSRAVACARAPSSAAATTTARRRASGTTAPCGCRPSPRASSASAPAAPSDGGSPTPPATTRP